MGGQRPDHALQPRTRMTHPFTTQREKNSRPARRTLLIESGVFAVALGLTVASAIGLREAQSTGQALPSLSRVQHVSHVTDTQAQPEPAVAEEFPAFQLRETQIDAESASRWFDGRPVRRARTIEMIVTAYSPDDRSCGIFADGQTATLHSVWTNGFKLVAADPKVLPYGTMLTIPGYALVDQQNEDAGEYIVPVLDCGGAIKGNRLDLLFPTHDMALQWGRRTIEVTVWEYADGKPAPNPRKVR